MVQNGLHVNFTKFTTSSA